MDVTLHLKDKVETRDISSLNDENVIKKLASSPKKTRVVIKNHDTGEVLADLENKVVIPGSAMNAMKAFGIECPVDFPTYNQEMDLDNSVSLDPKDRPNDPVVCLFCISDAGCGTAPKDVYLSSYTDRIKPAPSDPTSIEDFTPDMIMPFRYVNSNADLSEDLRQYYFGKKTFNRLGKIGYYFKRFDTVPQLHLRYADGTQITENIYDEESDQLAECYVEMRLRITRIDFRDYFENVLGWDKARISTLSLCFAWYDDSIDDYVYYQDILPYTILNFSFQYLVDATVALDILYDIYY